MMDYEEVVKLLNMMQTPGGKGGEPCSQHAPEKVRQIGTDLEKLGIKVSDLDTLNVIHVSGTKGKGSTCAFVESMLRHHGFRTGLYSSPHLISVTERIRLDGDPLTRQRFVQYFHHTRDLLQAHDRHVGYFHFLTLMAFYIFLEEKVDVAIMEVGIGGAYDCTNVVRKPLVCGVASLGMDHTAMLGSTLPEIAWQKAGIFKPGIPAFTVKQTPAALAVLQQRALEIGCPLFLCPNLSDFTVNQSMDKEVNEIGDGVTLSLKGEHQRDNAALALCLVNLWLHDRGHAVTSSSFSQSSSNDLTSARPFCLTPAMHKGLACTRWLGRAQVVPCGHLTLYLDGAHTKESLQACLSWFDVEQQQLPCQGISPQRVLLFNITGQRDAQSLLSLLQAYTFDFAIFCPNISSQNQSQDQKNLKVTPSAMIKASWEYKGMWDRLEKESPSLYSRLHKPSSVPAPSLVFPNISDSLDWLKMWTRVMKRDGQDRKREENGGYVEDIEEMRNGRKKAEIHDGINRCFDEGFVGLRRKETAHRGEGKQQTMEEDEQEREVLVLVTGSLHLVGCTLKVLLSNVD
uniref:folylpolyglutamate synthase, mitochondrial-like isoform X1 n=1 Tax=Myxine glutinosa TaxID=7769 RepID=UPI00358F4BE2